MDTLLQDVCCAVRRLAAQRGFTLTALVTLALGIGANVAMFGIVYGLLLRPLPYPDPERLVRVGESSGGRGGVSSLTNRSLPLLEGAESFEHLAAYQASSLEWAGPEGGVTLRGARVSPALFPLLRATPHLGRLFTDEEAREGADGVVLLSHRAWTNRFASDPDVVGTVIVGVVADVRGDVLALVVRQGAGLVAAGIVLGVLASAGSARLLESFLFGVAADDRLTFVAAPLVLAVVAVVACWLPGRRAARIHPMDALRVE